VESWEILYRKGKRNKVSPPFVSHSGGVVMTVNCPLPLLPLVFFNNIRSNNISQRSIRMLAYPLHNDGIVMVPVFRADREEVRGNVYIAIVGTLPLNTHPNSAQTNISSGKFLTQNKGTYSFSRCCRSVLIIS
jgi:hypothetical protein